MITARVIRWVWGRIANGSPTGQLCHLTPGDLDDQLAVALHPLAVEWRQQQLALAHVRPVVEGQHRVRAERRLEHGRVRLAGVEDGGVAGEQRFDEVGLGDVDDAPEVGEADGVDVPKAALIVGEEAERVARVMQQLHDAGGARARGRAAVALPSRGWGMVACSIAADHTASTGCSASSCLALEDDRALAVEQDPIVEVGDHRAGQHQPLDVAADPDQVVDLVAVADPGHVLVDDRAGVELGGDVVGGGADQLDPALVRACGRARRRRRRAGSCGGC